MARRSWKRRWRRASVGRRRAVLTGVPLLALTNVVGLSWFFSVSCRGQPDCVTLSELRDGDPLPEALHLYAADGALLAEVAGPRRRALPQERIPDLLARAFVAVEDRRFWEHGGVDARGVLRAAARNLREGEITEGASTIPMQLVRTLWGESLRDMGPWRRKIIEARTAPRLIDELGHESVLTLYLNAIYLGNGVYGVERASHHYFGVGVESLDLGRIATLVGITRSPEYFDPRAHPDRAWTVRNGVLQTLVDAGVVPPAAALEASTGDLGVTPEPGDRALVRRSHLTAAITREIRRIAPSLAGRPGLNVHTTVDPDAQAEAERALAAQLAAIESGRYGPFLPAMPDSGAELEGAAVALDATSGAVLAWVGGRDFTRSEFDRVEQARRQVGSLVKPFLVAFALESGYGMLHLVSADTVPIPTADGSWLPADHVRETILPLREALVRSSNRAAAHLGSHLGLASVGANAERLGLSGPIPEVPATSIGAFDASLLEMTEAYAALGNRGSAVAAHLVRRIEATDGTVLWTRPAPAPGRVLDERIAFAVLDAMRAVVDRGTGFPVRTAGYRGPAAGKTGTTNDGRDAWFIGLTPELAAGVWIGFDRPQEIVAGQGGGTLAAPVWADWMRGLARVPRPARRAWIPPPGVTHVRYDVRTGEVLGPDCGGRPGVDYHEAWVIVGRYSVRQCRSGVLGWLERLWDVVAPGDAEAVPVIPPAGRGR